MKTIQKYLILGAFFYCNLFLSQEKTKQDTSTADFDGPYVFYKNQNIEVKSITKKNQTAIPNILTFNILKNKNLLCEIDEKNSFEIKIKEKLHNEKSVYPQPKKIIAISDIEGNFFQLREFLIHNKVIDKNYNWTFGKGHLVLNGDFFDRGLWVTQSLWLIYTLEEKAEKQGGKVHFIIGNHEIMNHYGNTKYVRKKYEENAILLGEKYTDFYTPHTELGRWLQTKNIVEKIGNYLFVHAGLSPEVAALGLNIEDINNYSRPHYFNGYEIRKSGDKVLETLFSGSLSPFWYRDIAKEKLPSQDLEKILKQYHTKKMVIGHTLSKEVKYLYNQRVINIDTDHAKGITQGLLIKNGKEYRVDIKGKRTRMK